MMAIINMGRLSRAPRPVFTWSGFLLFRAGDATMSPLSDEVAGLGRCIEQANQQLDVALDKKDRRAFRVWCHRRAALIARCERALIAEATSEVPA